MADTSVEIRKVEGAIDEIVMRFTNGSVHIEQMTDDGWFIGVESPDGYHQFWLGAKNRRSHVEVRYVEHTPPTRGRRA